MISLSKVGPNELERGKPLGTMRLACARTPPQSFRSDQLSVKVRPAELSQVVGALLEFVSEHQTKQSALALAGKAGGAPDHD